MEAEECTEELTVKLFGSDVTIRRYKRTPGCKFVVSCHIQEEIIVPQGGSDIRSSGLMMMELIKALQQLPQQEPPQEHSERKVRVQNARTFVTSLLELPYRKQMVFAKEMGVWCPEDLDLTEEDMLIRWLKDICDQDNLPRAFECAHRISESYKKEKANG